VVFDSPTALTECKRLRSLAQRTRVAKDGGKGRVLRPRTQTFKVRDDEQE
jgi:hypothetical protein